MENIIDQKEMSEAKEQSSEPLFFASNTRTDTMGITCKINLAYELFNTVSLGNIFPEIVFNFEAGKAWWANRDIRHSLKNFGYVQKGFVDDCWGKGSIGFKAKNILQNLKHVRKHKKVTLLADPKTQTIYLQAGEERIVDEFSYDMIPVENILSAIPEKPVIPIMNKLYGVDVNVLRLKQAVERAKAFNAKHIPFSMTHKDHSVAAHFEFETDQCVMSFTPGSSKSYLQVPPKHSFEHIVSLADLRPIVKNYRRPNKYRDEAPPHDIVSLRFGDNQNRIYLLKKATNGTGKFISGAMISTIVTDSFT
jgi:hypothetical protein